MIKRFNINDEGYLTDRDGTVLGKVKGITLDMPLDGGKGEGSSVLGSLPTIKRDSPLAPGVDVVWQAFVEIREREGKPLRSTDLTPSNARMISKGLKEVRGTADLIRALDGLVNWQQKRGGGLDLSRLLKTHPNGNSLHDQIEFFIGEAGETGEHGGSQPITQDEMIKINRLKDTVTQTYDKPHRADEFHAAVDKLKEKGWSVDPSCPPTFIAP